MGNINGSFFIELYTLTTTYIQLHYIIILLNPILLSIFLVIQNFGYIN